METSPDQIASDWIAYALREPDKASEEVRTLGRVLCDLAVDEPALAWDAILAVVDHYTEDKVFSDNKSEAQHILSNTAAGPLEDILATHGASYIEVVEAQARRDRRMAWMLGCVWQNSMTEEVWKRVQQAAGGISR